MRTWFAAAALTVAVGCKGNKECTEYEVGVTVVSPVGDPVAGASVEVNATIDGQIVDTPCTDDGGGAYTCQISVDASEAQVSATPGAADAGVYMANATTLALPETCDDPLATTVTLQPTDGA